MLWYNKKFLYDLRYNLFVLNNLYDDLIRARRNLLLDFSANDFPSRYAPSTSKILRLRINASRIRMAVMIL